MSYLNYKDYTSASELSKIIAGTTESGFKPLPEAINKLLSQKGLSAKQFKNVRRYNRNNALKCITANIGDLIEIDRSLRKAKETAQANIDKNIPPTNPNGYPPRKKGETNAHRELDKQTLYMENNKKRITITEEELSKLISEAVEKTIKEVVLGPNDRFTPYTKQEIEQNFSPFTNNTGGSPEERNPSYAKAKKEAEERLRKKKLGLENAKNTINKEEEDEENHKEVD